VDALPSRGLDVADDFRVLIQALILCVSVRVLLYIRSERRHQSFRRGTAALCALGTAAASTATPAGLFAGFVAAATAGPAAVVVAATAAATTTFSAATAAAIATASDGGNQFGCAKQNEKACDAVRDDG